MEHEINRQIVAASALLHCTKLKRELLPVPTLTYGHDLWIVIKYVWIRATETSFLHTVRRQRVQHSTAAPSHQKSVEVVQECDWDPLGHIPLEIFQTFPTDGRAWSRPKHDGETTHLIWPECPLRSPRRSWKTLLRKRTSRLPWSVAASAENGWMDVHHLISITQNTIWTQ